MIHASIPFAVLGSGAAAIAGVAAGRGAQLDKEGGLLLRRERRRIAMAAIYAVGALVWAAAVAAVVDGPATALAALWPFLLIGADLVAVAERLPDEAEVQRGAASTGGQHLVAAVFASGVLLSVLNKSDSGHLPESARLMLSAVLLVISTLVPVPAAGNDAPYLVHAGQRNALHAAIGLFLVAVAKAWESR